MVTDIDDRQHHVAGLLERGFRRVGFAVETVAGVEADLTCRVRSLDLLCWAAGEAVGNVVVARVVIDQAGDLRRSFAAQLEAISTVVGELAAAVLDVGRARDRLAQPLRFEPGADAVGDWWPAAAQTIHDTGPALRAASNVTARLATSLQQVVAVLGPTSSALTTEPDLAADARTAAQQARHLAVQAHVDATDVVIDLEQVLTRGRMLLAGGPDPASRRAPSRHRSPAPAAATRRPPAALPGGGGIPAAGRAGGR